MPRVDKEIKARVDALNDEQLERKVKDLRGTITLLNEEVDYAARTLRDRRNRALREASARA